MVGRPIWTPETIQAWNNEQNERRKGKGKPPIDTLSPEDKAVVLETEKKELVEIQTSIITTQAWYIGKHPLQTYPAPSNGHLLLPKNYHARDGVARLRVRKGQDLNKIVFQYYDEWVDPQTYPGDNYVSKDGIRAKRCEYLGPNPRVASYRFTGNEIEIEWWEEYINDTWIGKRKWKVEAEFDDVVEWWFLKDRNNY